MCNCKDTAGFKEKLNEAKELTESTGESHVVFNLNGHNFVAKESQLNDDFGICCYYLADGSEKKYISSAEVAEMKVDQTPSDSVEGKIQPEAKPATRSGNKKPVVKEEE